MENYIFEWPIPIENSKQVSLLVTSSLAIFATCLFVGLRMFAKWKSGKGFDASDWCILVSLFFNTAFHTDVFVMVIRGGFGFHVPEVAMRFGPDVLTLFFKCIMTFALLWNATTCFTKLSILLLYASLFPLPKMILACRCLGAFIVVWNIAGILAGILICQPLAMNWDPTIPGGKCGSRPMYYMGLGIINIVVEVTMLAMPFPVLFNLQMPLRKKLVIAGMFSVGFATCGITIYRQATLPAVDFADMTYSGVIATLLSGLEPSVALALACVPFLRPYFGGGFRRDHTSDYYGSGPSHGRSNKGGKSGENSRAFEELHDDASDVQLRPINEGVQSTHISAKRATNTNKDPSSITVHRQWEVNSDSS